MADHIGFYGSLPTPKSAEAMETERLERIQRERRKEREAKERAIQAGIEAGFGVADPNIPSEIAEAAAKAAIQSILESMGDYDWY